MSTPDLPFGPIGPDAVHLCVDMQNLFADRTPWHTPWMARVRPIVHRLARAHPARTVFTRFVPPEAPEQRAGAWRRYFERWDAVTRRKVPAGLVDLVPELAALVPPARVVDKAVYSAFGAPGLDDLLRGAGVATLVVSGAETDVCVLASVLAAVDRGYRVVIATDALCSGSDRTHDALMTLYRTRFGQQIETAKTAAILAAWAGDGTPLPEPRDHGRAGPQPAREHG